MFARKLHWSQESRSLAKRRRAAAASAMKLGVVALGILTAALTLVAFETLG